MVPRINGSPHRPVITSCYHARDERGRPDSWIRHCLVTQLNLRSTRTRSDIAGSMGGADINRGASVWVILDWWWSIKVDDRNSYISRKKPCIGTMRRSNRAWVLRREGNGLFISKKGIALLNCFFFYEEYSN